MLRYLLRVQLNIGGVDFKRNLRQLHVRPYVLLLLLYYLIDQNHEVFRGKGTAQQLKAKMRSAVEKEYPETEEHLPWEERDGHLPASILQTLREAEEQKAAEGRSQKQLHINRDKNATPGDGPTSLEKCLDDIRPHAVCVDKSVEACTDPATLREGGLRKYGSLLKDAMGQKAVEKYGELYISSGRKEIPQWHSKYFSQVMPFVIPRMVSGPDYDPEKRWRRSADAPFVSVRAFAAGFARRVEAFCRTD